MAEPSMALLKRAGGGLLSILTGVGLWQALVMVTGVPGFILPGPVDVFRAMANNAALIAFNAGVTAGEVLAGMALGTVIGVAVAITLMLSSLLRKLVLPVLVLSQTIPVFALAPVITLWLGYGLASKVVVTVLMIFFPVASAFMDGLRFTDRDLVENAEILGAGPAQILFHIRIPAALPSLASGLRLAAVYAPIGAVVSEWVGASKGLGYLMLDAHGRAKADLMFACLLVLAFFTILLHGLTVRLTRRLAVWPRMTTADG